MLHFFQENLATILVGLALLLIVILIIRKLLRERRAGGACACGCHCKSCPGSALCHPRQTAKENEV